MFQKKKIVRKIKTHISLSVSENRAVYNIIWKNMLETGRRQMTIWRMPITCWIP